MVNCDILMFAGLAFIAFAVLKKLNVPDTGLLIVGIGASVLGTCNRWINTGIPFLDNFLGFIWGTGRESYFPLLTWFLFPVFGYLFGRRIRRCSDKPLHLQEKKFPSNFLSSTESAETSIRYTAFTGL